MFFFSENPVVRFNINALSYQYGEFHYNHETVVRTSYLYNGSIYTCKTSLYQVVPQKTWIMMTVWDNELHIAVTFNLKMAIPVKFSCRRRFGYRGVCSRTLIMRKKFSNDWNVAFSCLKYTKYTQVLYVSFGLLSYDWHRSICRKTVDTDSHYILLLQKNISLTQTC